MQQNQMYAVMNKTVLVFALALLAGTSASSAKNKRQSDLVVSVTPGSVTFSVEDVKIAKEPLPEMGGRNLALNWLEWSERDSYLGSSFADMTLVDGGDNPFFSMVCLAYAHHRPIILTPDAMWILICHGFSQYVNHDPDKFRDYLVSHQGKETLLIQTSPETTSEQKVEKFASLIGKETKGDLAGSDPSDSSANAVSIKTMHKSKGLQFPVVFCMCLMKKRAPGPSPACGWTRSWASA